MMFKEKKYIKIGAIFDGEMPSKALDSSTSDPELAHYVKSIMRLREGAAMAAKAPVISDAQFQHFMEGIREGIAAPTPRLTRLWALASLATAVLVLILVSLAYLGTGTTPVRATEVESVSTELEGVTVHFYETKEGVSTIWVNLPENDLW